MTKLEKPQYKFVQYKERFSESWGLGFSLMNVEETKGWEYNPVEKRKATRSSGYPLRSNENDVLFTYGITNDN